MTRIAPEAQRRLAAEIAAAGGREVSFVGELDTDGVVVAVRPVARGTVEAVLALPGVARRGEMVLHNHPSGVLEPSAADLDAAVRLHDGGIGFGIIDNAAEQLYVVVEVPRAAAYTALDPVAIGEMLGPRGAVARAMGQYEDRASQRDMASYIADTYNEGGVSLLEAGTGVGKSFAYLVPALEWARLNGERTVVSTNTINLQEQLVGRDLPFLARALANEEYVPSFALLKGWNNYLCLARLELAEAEQGSLFGADERTELEGLVEWSARTADGSLSDLADPPSQELWEEVRAEADLCHRLECPHFNECFLFAARRRAAEADVVVVNHHLLAADMAVRRVQENWRDAAVLPPYRRLILDEAHHLEDVAAQHLGSEVTSRGVQRLLGRLERNGKGLLPSLLAALARGDDPAGKRSVDLLRGVLLPAVADARAHADRVLGLLADRLVGAPTGVLRLDDAFATDPVWSELGPALDNLVNVLQRIKDGVATVADAVELSDDPSDRRTRLMFELRGVTRRLDAVLDGLLLTLRPQALLQVVRWIERRGQRPQGALPFPIALAAVPLDLAPVLRDALFDRIDTVVLTSATLAVGGEFTFLKRRVGLDTSPSLIKYEEILPSPFDFRRQCLFAVPVDLPDPRTDEAGHDRAVFEAIVQLAHAADGGLFVLFTSHAALRRAAQALKPAVGSRWPLLVQGEGQRDHLLRRFRDAGSAILLGTDSFWEGVDVPGRPLRVLVLAKLPFRVPSEPLTAARLEALQARGEDGFRDYLLPLAALKLKQGFGRLIRARSDTGVVVLMDARIINRPYGAVLLASLPPAERVIAPWFEVRRAAEEFLAPALAGSVEVES